MDDARMGFPPAIPRARGTRIAADPMLLRIGVAVILSLLLTLPALLLDGRMLQGENVWVKPIKFQIALAIYLVTLAVFASLLPKDAATTRRLRWIGLALTLGTLAELLWVGGSAMFATASHYNPHPVMSAIYLSMGGVATVLILGSLMMGLSFWSARDSHLPEAGKATDGLSGKMKIKVHIDACPDAEGKLTVTLNVDSQMNVVGQAARMRFLAAVRFRPAARRIRRARARAGVDRAALSRRAADE